jgi:hypothetical protein
VCTPAYHGLRYPVEAKPNLSQPYLSRLSLAKPAKLHFFKTPASGLNWADTAACWNVMAGDCMHSKKKILVEHIIG